MSLLPLSAAGLIGGILMAGASQAERAIEMAVERSGDMVEVKLLANSPTSQRVEYVLELSGTSSSRHSGSTQVQANKPAVLSTMRMQAGGEWCVTARIVEQDGGAYEYSEGSCA